MLTESISRNSILLGLFAVATTAMIAGTLIGTREQIAANIRHAEELALLEIVPRSQHNNSMLDESHPIADDKTLGLREEKRYFIARQDGEPVAVILPLTSREGYTGDIDLIVGIYVDGRIAGVRALNHRETPGLGDKVDHKKSNWIDGFIDKSLQNPTLEKWAVKKDGGEFDQFTGATITPRAVTKSIRQALQYFDEHRDELLGIETPANSPVNAAATEAREIHAAADHTDSTPTNDGTAAAQASP